jgi:hypothetical protein
MRVVGIPSFHLLLAESAGRRKLDTRSYALRAECVRLNGEAQPSKPGGGKVDHAESGQRRTLDECLDEAGADPLTVTSSAQCFPDGQAHACITIDERDS